MSIMMFLPLAELIGLILVIVSAIPASLRYAKLFINGEMKSLNISNRIIYASFIVGYCFLIVGSFDGKSPMPSNIFNITEIFRDIGN